MKEFINVKNAKVKEHMPWELGYKLRHLAIDAGLDRDYINSVRWPDALASIGVEDLRKMHDACGSDYEHAYDGLPTYSFGGVYLFVERKNIEIPVVDTATNKTVIGNRKNLLTARVHYDPFVEKEGDHYHMPAVVLGLIDIGRIVEYFRFVRQEDPKEVPDVIYGTTHLAFKNILVSGLGFHDWGEGCDFAEKFGSIFYYPRYTGAHSLSSMQRALDDGVRYHIGMMTQELLSKKFQTRLQKQLELSSELIAAKTKGLTLEEYEIRARETAILSHFNEKYWQIRIRLKK